METKIATVFVLFIATTCSIIVNQEYHNPNLYYQVEKETKHEYQTKPIAISDESVNLKYDGAVYENTHPKYEFQYAVNDEQTGDVKSHYEIRDGDDVKGMYTVLDADGYKRTVEYTANNKNGFKATVYREPVHQNGAHHVKHTNDNHLQNNRINYKPTVSTTEKYSTFGKYLKQNSEPNKYSSNSAMASLKSNFETVPNIKYGIPHKINYELAPEVKYTSKPDIIPAIITPAPEYNYVTEVPYLKYIAEPNHKHDVQQYGYATSAPQHDPATEIPQHNYATDALRYEYITENPQYKYVTQTSTSQFVPVPERYLTSTLDERKPQNLSHPNYNYYGDVNTQPFKPFHEYNYRSHNQGFVYGH